MTVGGKILITSKRAFAAGDSASDLLPLRKPIKGCYCVYHNKKSKIKPQQICTTASDTDFWPCSYCKSNFDIKLSDLPIANYENDYQLPESPTFSSDTFKKISKINYTPTSEFLGNVKRKTSKQDIINKSNSHASVLTVEKQTSRQNSSKKSSALEIQSAKSSGKINDSIVSEKSYDAPEIQTIFTSTTSYKNSSSTPTDKLKKTTSWSSDPNPKVREEKEKSVKNLPRILVQSNCRCRTCLIKDGRSRNSTSRRQVCGKCGGKRLFADKTDSEEDKETREINEFRSRNYFDTHGSSRTIMSNPSTAELLKQHKLNDRLFPEPVDEDNLVVSVALLSTDQVQKIIHYFPRNIIRQDYKKQADVGENEKKTERKCPLTGHLINFYKFNDIKKPESYVVTNKNGIINSLALNFQKKIAR